MKRFGRLALVAAVVLVAVGVLQTRNADGSAGHGSTLGKIAYVTEGVVQRTVDLVHWASDQLWGEAEADASHASAASTQQEGFRWEGRVDRGEAIEIKGVNGDIVAEIGSGSSVEVVAEKRARRSDPDEVRIEVVEHEAGVTVCAVYPGRDNRCEPGDGGKNSVRNNDVQVTFHVRVPEGVDFHGRTVNGDVRAADLASDVEATTVNGGLELSTTGSVAAQTVNGSIRATMHSRDWDGTLEFETVNGSISLDVPDDLDADVEASWVNGGLETDLPFTVQGRMSRRHAEGALGAGGPDIELTTVNGSIRIR